MMNNPQLQLAIYNIVGVYRNAINIFKNIDKTAGIFLVDNETLMPRLKDFHNHQKHNE